VFVAFLQKWGPIYGKHWPVTQVLLGVLHATACLSRFLQQWELIILKLLQPVVNIFFKSEALGHIIARMI
jgi:hypothetical protein